MYRFAIESPTAPDTRELIERHRTYSAEHSGDPADDHVLDVHELTEPSVSFFGMRDDDGALVAIGAIKRLSDTHAELKSMHTRVELRGQGLGRHFLDHLLEAARGLGLKRLSLETGTQEGFAAAARLYERAGFAECEPFAGYRLSPNSVYLSREL